MAPLRSLSRLTGTAAFTVVETVTLGLWLALVTDVPALSTIALVGVGILVVGLVVEAVVNTVVVNGFDDIPLGRIGAFSVTEAAIWIVWLAAADQLADLTGVAVAGVDLTGIVAAGVLLFALMLPQHAIEDNVLRGEPFASDLLQSGTVAFTFVEAAGATIWLALVRHGDTLLADADLTAVPTVADATPAAVVGLGLLAAFLFVEHLMGLQFALRKGRAAAGI